jgi:hypothetical protein
MQKMKSFLVISSYNAIFKEDLIFGIKNIMSKMKKFTIIKGDTAFFQGDLTDDNGTDFFNASVKLNIRDSNNLMIIQKTVTVDNENKFNIKLNSNETEILSGVYFYDIELFYNLDKYTLVLGSIFINEGVM